MGEVLRLMIAAWAGAGVGYLGAALCFAAKAGDEATEKGKEKTTERDEGSALERDLGNANAGVGRGLDAILQVRERREKDADHPNEI